MYFSLYISLVWRASRGADEALLFVESKSNLALSFFSSLAWENKVGEEESSSWSLPRRSVVVH